MAKASTGDLVLGIVLIVLGALFLLGRVGIPYLETVLAVAAIIVGVLILMGKMRGAQWMGIALVVIGILVLATDLLDFLTGTIADVIHIVLGVLLVLFGVLKVMGRK